MLIQKVFDDALHKTSRVSEPVTCCGQIFQIPAFAGMTQIYLFFLQRSIFRHSCEGRSPRCVLVGSLRWIASQIHNDGGKSPEVIGFEGD